MFNTVIEEMEQLPSTIVELDDLTAELYEEYYRKREVPLSRERKREIVTRYNQAAEKVNIVFGWKRIIKLS